MKCIISKNFAEGIVGMLHIGCHLSNAKGYLKMGREAVRIGADTFAFFTRNPRGGNRKAVDEEDMRALRELLEQEHFAPLVSHAPYTYNLCSDKESNRIFAKTSMKEDLEMLELLPGNYYNFHPGNHMKQGAEAAAEIIADSLNEIMWEDMQTMVLLETMAGKGTEVGRSFEELQSIIERVKIQDRIGVCLDTCHISDAGYDITPGPEALEEILAQFDRVIGLDRLRAIHINDSKNPAGSHKDRHAKIGEGMLGMEAFRAVVTHPRLRELPFILETPQEDNDGYAREIRMLREIAGEW